MSDSRTTRAAAAPALRSRPMEVLQPPVATPAVAPSAGASRTVAAPGALTTPAPPGGVALLALEPHDLVWLADLREHLVPAGSAGMSPEELSTAFDEYHEHWTQLPHDQRWDPTYLILCLGVALGDLVIARSQGAGWRRVARTPVVTVAVRLEERRVTVFPVDAVTRRWHAGRTGWIVPWLAEIAPVAGDHDAF